jgi:MoaA/NifB/PqqE/SkfB family radical SAM enzyme
MLQKPLFQQVIDQLAPTLSYLTFYFQGEPYLHPQFLDMVQYAAERKIYTATSTNAHYLKDESARLTVESGLDRLIISIDGTTQDTYQSYRVGGSLEKVIEGTRNILAWKKKLKSLTPHVIFQFLVVKPNEHQIPEVYALAKELGVDQVVLKTAQIYDYEQGSDLIPM